MGRESTHDTELSTVEQFVKEFGRATPGYADWQYTKIMEQIRDFEEQLDNDHEVALQLASFGTSTLMAVDSIWFQNPDMMYFWGTINGNQAQCADGKPP